jgi:hypothetical protein
MNRPNLAELIRESARHIEEERSLEEQVARVTESVKARLAPVLHAATHKAESDQEVTCSFCGQTFDLDQHPDEETSSTSGDDDVNEDDDVNDYDNRTVTRVRNLAKSLTAAAKKAQSALL